jgi:hypothetical protein
MAFACLARHFKKSNQIKMKKTLCLLAFVAIAFVQNSFAQEITVKSEEPGLLSTYYNVKDALVAGKAQDAASKAAGFVKIAQTADAKILPEENRKALLKSAGDIAGTMDIKKQREYFAILSEQLIAVAEVSKLSQQPIYKAYCPMKKSSWLSSEAAIKNPYYGNAMLTCGKVTETLK